MDGFKTKKGKDGKSKADEATAETLKYTVFLGGIGELTQSDIQHHFEERGILVFKVDFPTNTDKKFCFVTFRHKADVAKLLETKWIAIKQKTAQVKPYTYKDGNTRFWERKKREDRDLEILESNKQSANIQVKEDRSKIDFGNTNTSEFLPGKTYSWPVYIRNISGQEFQLLSVTAIPSRNEFELQLHTSKKTGLSKSAGRTSSHLTLNRTLEPGDHCTITINFKPISYGIFRQELLIRFAELSTHHNVTVEVANKAELELLAPESDFKEKEFDEVVRRIIPAFPPERKSKTHYHTAIETHYIEHLGEYPLPDGIQKDIDEFSRFRALNPWKVKENYKQRMHSLLWVEEAQGKKNIRQYDLLDVQFEYIVPGGPNSNVRVDEPCCRIQVPGLAEKRPSVLYVPMLQQLICRYNDILYCWLPGTADVEYEGIVRMVEQGSVLVVFCESFQRNFPQSTKWNVRFGFNRMTWRVMHRAVDIVDLDLLWPQIPETVEPLKIEASSVGWFDKDIKNNQEQWTAVVNILNKTFQKAPYLIFGPFGTGKSRTLVEIIRQIMKSQKDCKILVCTPSNSAADAFVERLKDSMTPQQLFRLNAFNRGYKSVPDAVKMFSLYKPESDLFDVPSVAELKQFAVIVATCNNCGTLYGVGIGNKHFTHIIMDEAAQVMETEGLIPLTMARPGHTTVIMAGDVKQMGPILMSPSARHHGMDKSIMERLKESYTGLEQDVLSNVCTHLVKNYRSHKAILHFLSQTFYEGKLQALADPKVVNSLLGWSKLPNKQFPILFYSVEGEDLREGDSPSFFNRHEVITVKDLVQSLVHDKNVRISESDIGIISPYYKQVSKMRMLIKGGMKIGSPEEFQGHEKKALFLSTVRSSDNWFSHDHKYGLGFLNNEKRFNTSMSRAIALVVIVGNPYVLYSDPTWRKLIQYCNENNAYVGPKLPEKAEDFLTKVKHQEAQEQARPKSAASSDINNNNATSPRETPAMEDLQQEPTEEEEEVVDEEVEENEEDEEDQLEDEDEEEEEVEETTPIPQQPVGLKDHSAWPTLPAKAPGQPMPSIQEMPIKPTLSTNPAAPWINPTPEVKPVISPRHKASAPPPAFDPAPARPTTTHKQQPQPVPEEPVQEFPRGTQWDDPSLLKDAQQLITDSYPHLAILSPQQQYQIHELASLLRYMYYTPPHMLSPHNRYNALFAIATILNNFHIQAPPPVAAPPTQPQAYNPFAQVPGSQKDAPPAEVTVPSDTKPLSRSAPPSVSAAPPPTSPPKTSKAAPASKVTTKPTAVAPPSKKDGNSFGSEYECMYYYQDHEVLFYKPSLGYPPLMTYDTNESLKFKISLFGLKSKHTIQGNLIQIQLFPDTAESSKSVYTINTLHSSSQTQLPSEGRLLVSVPAQLFHMDLIDISSSNNLMVIILPKICKPF